MKKATAPKLYEYLWRHYGLMFWKDCESCGFKFRREHGFRYLSEPFYGGAGTFRYLCATCAPTAEAATRLIECPPARPVVPPPPPNSRGPSA